MRVFIIQRVLDGAYAQAHRNTYFNWTSNINESVVYNTLNEARSALLYGYLKAYANADGLENEHDFKIVPVSVEVVP